MQIKTLFIISLGFLVITANAGIIVPKKGEIEFGEVVVQKGKIYLIFEQGKMRGKIKYRSKKLAYYSTNNKVTN